MLFSAPVSVMSSYFFDVRSIWDTMFSNHVLFNVIGDADKVFWWYEIEPETYVKILTMCYAY